MNELLCLYIKIVCDSRISMAKRVDCDTGRKVKIGSIVGIVEIASFAVLENYMRAIV
jgi:hypothetical protein